MRPALQEAVSKVPAVERPNFIMILAPGCLFGMPPDNLGEIAERVDCPDCQLVLRILTVRDDKLSTLNEKLQSWNEKTNGSFWLKLRPRNKSPEGESWYRGLESEIDELNAELRRVVTKDDHHWTKEDLERLLRVKGF